MSLIFKLLLLASQTYDLTYLLDCSIGKYLVFEKKTQAATCIILGCKTEGYVNSKSHIPLKNS